MSNTLDQERREFEELCKNNPNYPKDFELHRMYQGHIKKWKPLIESNDPSIYSDWRNYYPSTNGLGYFNDDVRQIDVLLSQYYKFGSFEKKDDLSCGYNIDDSMISIRGLTRNTEHWGVILPIHERFVSKPDVFSNNMKDKDLRRNVMSYLLESYVFEVEKREDQRFMTPPGLRKNDHILLFDKILRTGNNPFDVLYYIKGIEYHREYRRRTVRVSLLFLMFWGLLFILIKC